MHSEIRNFVPQYIIWRVFESLSTDIHHTHETGMNISAYHKMMTGGVAAGKDLDLQFTTGKYYCAEDTVIIFAGKGHARIEIDFMPYDLQSGSVLTVSPKATVRCTEASDDFFGAFLAFDHSFAVEAMPRPEPAFLDFIRSYPQGEIPADRLEPLFAGIGNVAHFLYDNEGTHRMQIVKNVVQGILLELYDMIKAKFLVNKPAEVNRLNEHFLQFIHLVYEHGAREREVAFYADRLCITPRYLSKIVHATTGETAKDIINRHCLQEIKALLRTTNDSLQTIALQLHFPDQSFFTRYFKKMTGMTPTEYRANEDTL